MVMFPVKLQNEYFILKFMRFYNIAQSGIITKTVPIYCYSICISSSLPSFKTKLITSFKHLLSDQERTLTASSAIQLMFRDNPAVQLSGAYFYEKYGPTFFG